MAAQEAIKSYLRAIPSDFVCSPNPNTQVFQFYVTVGFDNEDIEEWSELQFAIFLMRWLRNVQYDKPGIVWSVSANTEIAIHRAADEEGPRPGPNQDHHDHMHAIWMCDKNIRVSAAKNIFLKNKPQATDGRDFQWNSDFHCQQAFHVDNLVSYDPQKPDYTPYMLKEFSTHSNLHALGPLFIANDRTQFRRIYRQLDDANQLNAVMLWKEDWDNCRLLYGTQMRRGEQRLRAMLNPSDDQDPTVSSSSNISDSIYDEARRLIDEDRTTDSIMDKLMDKYASYVARNRGSIEWFLKKQKAKKQKAEITKEEDAVMEKVRPYGYQRWFKQLLYQQKPDLLIWHLGTAIRRRLPGEKEKGPILWGPTRSGKTSIVRPLAHRRYKARTVQLNLAVSGVGVYQHLANPDVWTGIWDDADTSTDWRRAQHRNVLYQTLRGDASAFKEGPAAMSGCDVPLSLIFLANELPDMDEALIEIGKV